MASLKRRIASTQLKMRKRQRDKEEKELKRLQEQRNRSLRSAKRNIALAKAQEDAKDAAMKNSQAKAKLSRGRRNSGSKLAGDLIRGGRKLLKDLQGKQERKSVKRKTTARKK